MKTFGKKLFLLLLTTVMCVCFVPCHEVCADDPTITITTGLDGNGNITVNYDSGVTDNTEIVPGLTISYDGTNNCFIINITGNVTIYNCFEDPEPSFIYSDCDLKFTGNGTLNLIAKTNPDPDFSPFFSSFIHAYLSDIYIGDDSVGPTINFSVSLDSDDEDNYTKMDCFIAGHYVVKNSKLNVKCWGSIFAQDDETMADNPELETFLSMNNCDVKTNYIKLNDYDSGDKDAHFVYCFNAGSTYVKNTNITVTCSETDFTTVDPNYFCNPAYNTFFDFDHVTYQANSSFPLDFCVSNKVIIKNSDFTHIRTNNEQTSILSLGDYSIIDSNFSITSKSGICAVADGAKIYFEDNTGTHSLKLHINDSNNSGYLFCDPSYPIDPYSETRSLEISAKCKGDYVLKTSALGGSALNAQDTEEMVLNGDYSTYSWIQGTDGGPEDWNYNYFEISPKQSNNPSNNTPSQQDNSNTQQDSSNVQEDSTRHFVLNTSVK